MKIRVLSDHLANQIAAGEVVERPSSVAKELVENSIDADAARIEIDVEAGGRRLLRVSDDGCGMSRDDAILSFERHATSKISRVEDLAEIRTLGFRGEALASIAAIARVELVTKTEEEAEATRVRIEGGRMREVEAAARPRGTTIAVRDLFFNVPARRKFLRSEATETFHLTNLVTHYALAHPEIAFQLTTNGRETIRASKAADLRERAYQIFGAEFLENLLEVEGGYMDVVRVRGYTSAPRERRTSRDAQFLFVNGRFVRDRLVARALMEGYRSVLPHGVYPAALLFLDVPFEEVDVNVHPAKTEVRFRRATAITDAVRESIRAALAASGYAAARSSETFDRERRPSDETETDETNNAHEASMRNDNDFFGEQSSVPDVLSRETFHSASRSPQQQRKIEFRSEPKIENINFNLESKEAFSISENVLGARTRNAAVIPTNQNESTFARNEEQFGETNISLDESGEKNTDEQFKVPISSQGGLPPFVSAAELAREIPVESLSSNITPLGQLDDSFIIATDPEGLLLIDQHVAHERILFDKYRRLEDARPAESQNLLIPETFDLTPPQAAAFDAVADDLEHYGFGLMRLSGRTVAIRAVPADIPPTDARNLLSELLDTVDRERRGTAREVLRDRIAASLACRAAIKINMPLTPEKMRWLIDRLLTTTSSPTTCPHGRPVILRLRTRDIEKGFHRT
jgi:DNA mismatch repair protein MutL